MRVDAVATGLALGYALDVAFGDPRRWHPVAGFGSLASRLEQHTYAPRRINGIAHEVVLVGSALLVGRAAGRVPAPLRVPMVAAATWAVLGGTSLVIEAHAMDDLLRSGDLNGARRRIRNLVGRDPSALGGDDLARACVESVAENGADAVVSPLFWGAVAGLPGLLGYRAINTLDAMIGHRSPRYAQFGWAAARFDDVVNWAPARLTVAATAVATGSARAAIHVYAVTRRDAPAHPSPNAGVVEAAFSAALGRRLGGRNTYGGVVEDRGHLGDGPPVTQADIAPAARLHQRIGVISLAGVIAARLLCRAVVRRTHRRT